MSVLDVEIKTYMKEEKMILFACYKFFSEKHLGFFLISEDYSFEFWEFLLTTNFELKSKTKLALSANNYEIIKNSLVLDFLFSESLNKFLMITKNQKNNQIFLMIFDHNIKEALLLFEQTLF